jgi:putative SOS response-associated peptidase YedK
MPAWLRGVSRLGLGVGDLIFRTMCGRVRLSSDVSEIKLVFSIPPHRPTPNFPPSWNVVPTDPLPVVRYDAKAGERSLDLLRWGLVPYWAKDIKVGFANINAKAEGIESRPAFRDAFQRRRCLVPVDNFYEWKKTANGKQPYAIAPADRGLMALAGLWENWRSPAGEWVRSFAIVTTTPNELCAELHNRMPVVLAPDKWAAWLGQDPVDPHHLKSLLAPCPSAGMTCWPVSARVGNVKNNDPSLIEAVTAE